MIRLISVSAIAVVFAPMANAGIVTPVSSDRLVYALNQETSPQTVSQSAGPQFGPWTAQARAANEPANPNGNINASAAVFTSAQQSSFTSGGVAFSGFVIVDYDSIVAPNLGGSAINRCHTTFHIDGPTAYQLSATFGLTGSVTGLTTGSISLVDSNNISLFTLTGSGSQSGTLPTGDYTLKILMTADAHGTTLWGDSRRQIDATFTIPAPAGLAPLALGACLLRRRRV